MPMSNQPLGKQPGTKQTMTSDEPGSTHDGRVHNRAHFHAKGPVPAHTDFTRGADGMVRSFTAQTIPRHRCSQGRYIAAK